jgi:hypothetical protein
MSLLLRALCCLVVAICMASLSLGAAAHSTMVLDEAAPHASVVGAELPCPDCGTHRSIGCGQACAAAADDQVAGVRFAPNLVALSFAALAARARDGTPVGPLVTPPIG